MECVICKTEFEGKVGAKYCSPRCRKQGSRINSIVTDNVTLVDKDVTDKFEFTIAINDGEKELSVIAAKKKVRTAVKWEDVPIAAIPVIKSGNPQMPKWMNGRQYFLWWKNNFAYHKDKQTGEVTDTPEILNPFKSYDNFKYDMGGAASFKWGS